MRFVKIAAKVENYSNALIWLAELTQVNSSSRFYDYLKILNEIVDSSDLPNGGTSENQMDKIIEKYGENAVRGATLETDELIEIHNAFRNEPNIIPKLLLDKIVVGKLSEAEEEADKPNSANPRNTLFELTVAARVQSSGLYSKLNEDADVVFNFRNYKVFIECKRFFGEKNFESHVRKSNEQLIERYKKFGLPKNSLGICPIGFPLFSLTKVLNSEQLFLRANSIEEATLMLSDKVTELVKKNRQLIMRKSHSNTIATGFYFRLPVMLPSGFGNMSWWKFFQHYQHPQHKFYKVFDQISQKLKSKDTA